ncbi:hypothetical protein B0H19DRAFT_951928, partial [Mycena capillaripes]
PEEDVLERSLQEYACSRLSLDNRRRKLFEEHGLSIGATLLKNLNTHFRIPSSRKRVPREEADQLILNEMADDANRHRGPGTIGLNLAMAGHNLPR